MKTIQFTVDDRDYGSILANAQGIGLRGKYAASTYMRMLALQSVGRPENSRDEGRFKKAVVLTFTEAEYSALTEYVRIKKGYAGDDPVSAYVHKAAFDIMNKYPPKRGSV